MDNPATEPSGSLDTNQAGGLFASLLSPEVAPEEKPKEDAEASDDALIAAAEEAPADEPAEEDPEVTIKIDGKDVAVKLSELKAGYQQQKVSTERFMAAAETKKQAEAETAKAREERATTAANLKRLEAQTQALLADQQQSTDWDRLATEDPAEFVRQQHLYQKRQATLQQITQANQQIEAQTADEAQADLARHLSNEQQQLVAKLPELADPKKGPALQTKIAQELIEHWGFPASHVLTKTDERGRIVQRGVTDHRLILMAHEAMRYREIVAKASAATKKVATLPTKVERPGVSTESQGLDRRTSSYQKLAKSGRVEDAAAVFSSLI